MANIRKAPSGKYAVQVRRHGHSPQFRSFNTLKDAQQWARDIERDMDRGVFVDKSEAEATTLEQALDRYLREITLNKKGASKEASRINAWKKHPLAKRSMASIKGKDLATYRDERLKGGAATGTVLRDLSVVSHLFTVASTDWGMGITNPLDHVRKPKPGKARNRRLEGDEEVRLLTACRQSNNPLLASLVIVAIETGMRLSELLGLTWADVNLPRRTVTLKDTKNSDQRVIPLSLIAVTTFEAIPRHLKINRVFYTWGQRSDAIKGAWVRACKRAKITNFNFHDTRHECASRLAPHMPPQTLAKVMGWRSIQMAMRYYNPKEEELLKAIDHAKDRMKAA